jgi:hypothetical protein
VIPRALASLSLPLLVSCGFPVTPIASAGAARLHTFRPTESYTQANAAFTVAAGSDGPLFGIDGALDTRPAGSAWQGAAHVGYGSLPLPFQRPVGIEALMRLGFESTSRDGANRQTRALGALRAAFPIRLWANRDPWSADREQAPMLLLAPFAEGFVEPSFHGEQAEAGVVAGLTFQLEFWSRISP